MSLKYEPSSEPLPISDYSHGDMLRLRCEFVDFGEGKSLGSRNCCTRIDCDSARVRGCSHVQRQVTSRNIIHYTVYESS